MGSLGGTRVLGPMALAGALLAGCTASASMSDRDATGVASAPELHLGAGEVGARGQRASLSQTDDGIALRGSEEVPGPGSTTATGSASVEIVEERNEVCVEIAVRGLDKPSAAHLHAGRSGEAGEVVLALPAPEDGDGSIDACVTASSDVIDRLRADVVAFYVNIHTLAMPDGALRGQLRKHR